MMNGAVAGWGVVGALVIVIGMLFKYLTHRDKCQEKEAKRRDDQFLRFLSNHLAPLTANVRAMTEVVREMSVRTERCPGPKPLSQTPPPAAGP